MKKLWLFRLIALSIPVLFFVLLEGGLRLAGFGRDMPLFIANPAAPEYLLPRPNIVKRYFPENAAAPSVSIEVNFFRAQKPENGLRLFVQGGSTAAGFPYGLGASIAGMLDYRLKQSFPDRPVEVVNTALSAVNSYTLLDFADEIIAQRPDAVLIYAGHNEYLGLFGVGSSYSFIDSAPLMRLFLRLKDLRTFQWMQSLLWRGAPAEAAEKVAQGSRTFMAVVAKNKNIAKDSPVYRWGQSQFESNMRTLIAKYRAAGIPVLIATIGSNLADQAPFVSAALTPEQTQALDNALKAFSGKPDDDALLRQIVDLAETHQSAQHYFKLAQALLGLGRYEEAKAYFVLARDHDLLRFRAPSAINGIIRQLAKIEGVHLVEAEAALEAAASNGIIGKELMLEHLHPNVTGYFVIADAFYQALASSRVVGEFPVTISREEAQKEIPVLPPEDYYGRAKIAELVADYPFSATPKRVLLPRTASWQDKLGRDYYLRKTDWLRMAVELQRRTLDDPLMQILTAKLIAEAVPNDPRANYNAALNLLRHERPAEAPRYLLRALEKNPSNGDFLVAITQAYLAQQRLPEAETWLNEAARRAPQHPRVQALRQRVGATN